MKKRVKTEREEIYNIIEESKNRYPDFDKLSHKIAFYLEDLWPDEETFEENTKRLKLETTKDIEDAIKEYIHYRKEFAKSSEGGLSRGAINLVSRILEEAPINMEDGDLLAFVCHRIEDQFIGKKMESSLKQMRMESSQVVSDAIILCKAQKRLDIKLA